MKRGCSTDKNIFGLNDPMYGKHGPFCVIFIENERIFNETVSRVNRAKMTI